MIVFRQRTSTQGVAHQAGDDFRIDGTGIRPVTIHDQRHFARAGVFAAANTQHAINTLDHRLQPRRDFIQNVSVIAFEMENKDLATLLPLSLVFAPEVQLDARLLGHFLHEFLADLLGRKLPGLVLVEPAFKAPKLLAIENEITFQPVFVLSLFQHFLRLAEILTDVRE